MTATEDEQPGLFDLAEDAAASARLGTEGALAALDNAPAEWRARADLALFWLLQGRKPFTAEDVTRVAGEPPNPNAVGGLFKANRRHMRRIGYRAATRKAAHGRALGLWEAR